MNFEKARMLLDEAEKSHTMLSHGKKAASKDCRKYLMEVKKMMDSGRKETLTTLKSLPTKSRVKSVLEEPVDTHPVFSKPEPVVQEPVAEPEPVKKKPTLKPRVKKN
jgi:hypothetical protein